MINSTKSFFMVALIFLLCSCSKEGPQLQDSSILVVEEEMKKEEIIDTYDQLSLKELILKLQEKKISRVIYFFHSDGNISPLGIINIQDDEPEFLTFPGSGTMRKYELILLDARNLKIDILSIWRGAEEISPGERKTVSKLKVLMSADDARMALTKGKKELVIPATRISVLDVGPLLGPWDGSFIVKKSIVAIKKSLDDSEGFDVRIEDGTNVTLLNYSDEEILYNGVMQYMLKIKFGEYEGWVPEEFIAFRGSNTLDIALIKPKPVLHSQCARCREAALTAPNTNSPPYINRRAPASPVEPAGAIAARSVGDRLTLSLIVNLARGLRPYGLAGEYDERHDG